MTQRAIDSSYSEKSDSYFSGFRQDLIAQLPSNPNANILEIGCSAGSTGELALSEGKCGSYCAVELASAAAERARQRLTEVVTGDIETIRLPWEPCTFDVLILSEVLEHLIDPWAVLRKLHVLLKPGAIVFASSPNVSHFHIVLMLLRGEWKLTDCGIMDRTHLRWFTPSSFLEMFEQCGYTVVSSGGRMGWKAKLVSAITCHRFDHLLSREVSIRAFA